MERITRLQQQRAAKQAFINQLRAECGNIESEMTENEATVPMPTFTVRFTKLMALQEPKHVLFEQVMKYDLEEMGEEDIDSKDEYHKAEPREDWKDDDVDK
ncbi:hypothetical protein DOTSEDRAFT_22039 [Dothistroma septosporum NZE10]|uniref:Uncharacterized protein n=1 Tax=Dothistroma septosporum (strain NZE10 / CBS 128990) TaxID=675120 RepID=N1PU82_DOTSN|nr:hypothetical protein DOTSEDRAFT_22039 [Dothistroma septosporum NZE10]